jgi:hypothetical protein
VLAGSEYAVTVNQGDDRCSVSRITAQGGKTYRQCALRLAEVIRAMADLGAGYPEVVDLLRKLDDRQALNCPVVANKLPTLMSVEELAEASRHPNFLSSSPTIKGSE